MSKINYLRLTIDEQYMHRCLQLAKLGAGYVAPNPMVGAVLVYHGQIIGEGFHQKYGQPHAEVNCISKAVENGYNDRLGQSVLYVSLEPCAHFGKTPPCADLVIKHKIPKVVIGCRDPFKEVDGKGIEKLIAAGIEVVSGVLENECKELNKRFFTFHTQHRPYIILKWAETSDGFMAPPPPEGKAEKPFIAKKSFGAKESKAPPLEGFGEVSPSGGGGGRLFISNDYTNRLVHKWRSEESAILVGTNTAANDDPELTTRLWAGSSPVRLIVDMHLRLPPFLKVFDKKVRTIVFNTVKHEERDNLIYYQVTEDVSIVHQVITALYQLKLQSVIVEGGAQLLKSFIDEETWDEARVISNEQLVIGKGLPAPRLLVHRKWSEINLLSDKIVIYAKA